MEESPICIMMTRIEVLSCLPHEVRGLIRDFEGNIEDNEVIRKECPSFPFTEKLAELDALNRNCIRGLLSLHFKGEEVEEACRALNHR